MYVALPSVLFATFRMSPKSVCSKFPEMASAVRGPLVDLVEGFASFRPVSSFPVETIIEMEFCLFVVTGRFPSSLRRHPFGSKYSRRPQIVSAHGHNPL